MDFEPSGHAYVDNEISAAAVEPYDDEDIQSAPFFDSIPEIIEAANSESLDLPFNLVPANYFFPED
jgi:hypothetical protein